MTIDPATSSQFDTTNPWLPFECKSWEVNDDLLCLSYGSNSNILVVYEIANEPIESPKHITRQWRAFFAAEYDPNVAMHIPIGTEDDTCADIDHWAVETKFGKYLKHLDAA